MSWGIGGRVFGRDADLNMINGGPGLQIPSSTNSQSASDRPPLKVASAITARTHSPSVSAQSSGGETSGCCLSPDHNAKKGQARSILLDRSSTY